MSGSRESKRLNSGGAPYSMPRYNDKATKKEKEKECKTLSGTLPFNKEKEGKISHTCTLNLLLAR